MQNNSFYKLRILIAILGLSVSWLCQQTLGQTGASQRPFEGEVRYSVAWSGPQAAEFGRLLPTQLVLTLRAGQLRAITLGGLYPTTTYVHADSNWVAVLDTPARSVWVMPPPKGLQPKVRLVPTGRSKTLAGQPCHEQLATLTWPDPTPHLPKPPDFKLTQVSVVLWVSKLPTGLAATSGAALSLVLYPGLKTLPLQVSGPVGADKQLLYTLTAEQVTRRQVAPSETAPPNDYVRRPFDPQGPIPGFVAPVGLLPK